jgi:hypothetical protein
MGFPDAAAPRVRFRSETDFASAGTNRWTEECAADLADQQRLADLVPRACTRVFVPELSREMINVKTATDALANPARPARTS